LIVKDEPEKPHPHPELNILDENLYISPIMAVAEATKAVAAMGALAKKNFELGCAQLIHYDPQALKNMDADEACLDMFADQADRFMIGLSKAIETEKEDRQLDLLMQTVPSFERIGDYSTNLVELAERLNTEDTEFSEMAKTELSLICDAVTEILDITLKAFESDDDDVARTVEPLEEVIDDMVLILRDRHTKRLKNGACSISSGLVFMEALTYLERVSDHCSSVAVMMLARNNEGILQNHYEYLREIHAGNDSCYTAEKNRRREQYINPLKNIQ